MSKIIDWTTNFIHLQNIIRIVFFLFSILVIIAIYGRVYIYNGQEKFEIIETQQTEIAELKEKIHWLRQVNELSIVLEQLLTPLQIDELKMLNERIQQDKYRQFRKPVKEKKCLD